MSRADGRVRRGLGVRPRDARLPRLGVHRPRRRRPGRRPHRRSTSASSRSATRRSSSSARPRSRRTCARSSRDWRAPGAQRLPARARGRLRLQQGLDARPRVQGARGGRRDRGGRRGHRLRARRLGRGHARARPRPGRSRSSRSSSPSGRGSRSCGRCSGSRRDAWRSAGDGARRCGRTGTCRRARSASTRRCSSPTTARMPPVIHVDSHAPLHDDDGRLVTDEQWGIYFKRDRHSVQGGASPLPKGTSSSSIPTRPAPSSPGFPDMWCAALSHCMARFEGCRAALPPDALGRRRRVHRRQLPRLRPHAPNVFVAADSNHGYKMIAVGREIARVLAGEHSTLLHPFRYERFATGDLHPVSNSPTPGADGPRHVVVGGGVNGLSVAWRLAERGADVVVLDKGRVGGGATGSAGGIVRNYYRADGDHRAGRAVGRHVRVRARGLRLASGRLPGGGARAAGRRPGGDPRAARAGGVRVGARGRRRALSRVPDLDLAGLGRAGGGDPARAPRRLGRRDADRAPPRRAGARAPARRSARAWRSSASSSARAASRRSRPARAGWSARPWSSRRGRGSPACGACSGWRPTSRWPASPARWCRTGRRRRASSRSAASDSAGGPRRAGRAPRPERAAAVRSRWPRPGPRGLGDLLPHGPRTASPAAGCRSS